MICARTVLIESRRCLMEVRSDLSHLSRLSVRSAASGATSGIASDTDEVTVEIGPRLSSRSGRSRNIGPHEYAQ
eukprot:4881940-Amphidinium_carterae.1